MEHEDGYGEVKGGQKLYTWTFSNFTDTTHLHRLVTVRQPLADYDNHCAQKSLAERGGTPPLNGQNPLSSF